MKVKEISEAARKLGLKVEDIYGIARDNDPFYVSDTKKVNAHWFLEQYKNMGSPSGLHLRRMHYNLLSKANVTRPCGLLYQNTNKDWAFLDRASKTARYLGLVPFEAFVDRQHPPDYIYSIVGYDSDIDDIKQDISSMEVKDKLVGDITSNFASFYSSQKYQKYHLEVWIEKSTMNDVLEPICRRYNANLIVFKGEASITKAIKDLGERIRSKKKAVRIFYLSDFDPAGSNMPTAAARKIEFLVREKLSCDIDIKLKHIALTEEQCKKYKLPRVPIKEAKGAHPELWQGRKDNFEEKYGFGATELDALEALHEGELKKIVVSHLCKFYDQEVADKISKVNSEIYDKVTDYVEDQIEEIDIDFEEIADGIPFEEPQLPKAKEVEADGWLYDSKLDYVSQLINYKKAKRVKEEVLRKLSRLGELT